MEAEGRWPLLAACQLWILRLEQKRVEDTGPLFASIRAGKPINDGEFMARSTLMAIIGRMATYTGKVIRWDAAMKSKDVPESAHTSITSLSFS